MSKNTEKIDRQPERQKELDSGAKTSKDTELLTADEIQALLEKRSARLASRKEEISETKSENRFVVFEEDSKVFALSDKQLLYIAKLGQISLLANNLNCVVGFQLFKGEYLSVCDFALLAGISKESKTYKDAFVLVLKEAGTKVALVVSKVLGFEDIEVEKDGSQKEGEEKLDGIVSCVLKNGISVLEEKRVLEYIFKGER